MLAAIAQVDAAMALVRHHLGPHEAHGLGVEGLGRADVRHEQAHRPDVGDLERPRELHARDDVFFLSAAIVDRVAGIDVDALGDGVADFLLLGDLRQLGPLAEGAVVQSLGLGAAVPADLLHAVIELDRMPVGIADVGVPVAARHVAADPADLDLLLLEVIGGGEDLLHRADLPGDLVDRDVLAHRIVAEDGAERLVRQQEGVVVGIVAHEDDPAVLEPLGHLLAPGDLLQVARVGDAEAEQLGIEIDPALQVGDIEAEMAQPPDLERLRIAHAADVVARCALGDRIHAFLLAGSAALQSRSSFDLPHPMSGSGEPRSRRA